MAPSLETSAKAYSPIIPSTPLRIVTDYLMDAASSRNMSESQQTSTETQNTPAPNSFLAQTAINQLAGTSVGFLFTKSPIHSSSLPPTLPTVEISPVKQRMDHQLSKNTYTRAEVEEMLTVKQAEANYWKGTATQQQAVLVLQGVHNGKLCQQLQAKEEKGKKKANTRLLADGMPQVLTQPELIRHVTEMEQARGKLAVQKSNRAQAKKELAEQMAEWRVHEKDREKENERRKAAFEQALEEWKLERAAAKKRGEKVKQWDIDNSQPKRRSDEYRDIPKLPKPKLLLPEVEEADDGEYFDLDGVVDSEDEDDNDE
ncbi:hypothetical protein FA15DRAFT_695692 [Coprinopsis marcescibilis]|uniref:Uncharacterized protein n=1 Tax=Coprinopsis marcescibilis TaxID=230819 RepID=A0A5C3L2W5_COPMA|nr:hypothetical protein FA15DRAFT_695692 [Coprinopsis marcescibilis]